MLLKALKSYDIYSKLYEKKGSTSSDLCYSYYFGLTYGSVWSLS